MVSVVTPEYMAKSQTRSQRIVEEINQPATGVVNEAILWLWEQQGTLTTFERPQQPGPLDNGKGYAGISRAYNTFRRLGKTTRRGLGRIIGVPIVTSRTRARLC